MTEDQQKAYDEAQAHIKETMESPEFQFQEIQDALLKLRGAQAIITMEDQIKKDAKIAEDFGACCEHESLSCTDEVSDKILTQPRQWDSSNT